MIHPSDNFSNNMDEEESMLLEKEDEEKSNVLHQLMKLKRSQRWIFVFISIFFLILAQAAAVLLGRFYYDQGGNSKWISTLVQTVGFPILYLPLCLLPASSHTSSSSSSSSSSSCSFKTLVWIHLSLGLAIGFDNLLYSYGLLLLSASAYSLTCGTQLIFSAIFSRFINSEKITIWTGMSVILLTISALVIALGGDSDSPSGGYKWTYMIGCLLTLLASLIYSLQLSLMQYSFENIIKRETFGVVLEMQIYTSLVASCVSVIGLFASGEWKMLRMEMEEFHKGQVSYVLTLVGTAFSWHTCGVR
ncbi:hypothetical protein HA466_0284530 [Hirschfeldia incana]|nr:hypothetical protein HA466_0284530 [Hirschfeldia incana]